MSKKKHEQDPEKELPMEEQTEQTAQQEQTAQTEAPQADDSQALKAAEERYMRLAAE